MTVMEAATMERKESVSAATNSSRVTSKVRERSCLLD